MNTTSKTNTFSDHRMKRRRRSASGQGLAEYALVFVLVAVVVIVTAALIGTAVQRLYALVAGVTGTQINNSLSAEHAVDIEEGKQFCVVVPSAPPDYPNGATVLNFVGTSQVPLKELTVSTDTGLFYKLGGSSDPFHTNPSNSSPDGGGGWIVYAIIANKADAGLCPRTVVLQSQHSQLAIATVQVLIQ